MKNPKSQPKTIKIKLLEKSKMIPDEPPVYGCNSTNSRGEYAALIWLCCNCYRYWSSTGSTRSDRHVHVQACWLDTSITPCPQRYLVCDVERRRSNRLCDKYLMSTVFWEKKCDSQYSPIREKNRDKFQDLTADWS